MDGAYYLGQPMTIPVITGSPTFLHEEALYTEGYDLVAGIDEVGRGPIAGPVVAAAVLLDPTNIPAGLADSKKLTARRREALYDIIMVQAQVAIASVPAADIDRINIRQATHKAMLNAWNGLWGALSVSIPARQRPFALVDGNDAPALFCPVRTIIKGDALVASIAAASIVAKVTRDRMMRELHSEYPLYGFVNHAGYPTSFHREALERHGPCPFHRFSFGPVARCQFSQQ